MDVVTNTVVQKNSLSHTQPNGQHMCLHHEAKVWLKRHIKEQNRERGAVPYNVGVSRGLWGYRRDRVPNATAKKKEELPLRWKLQGGREGVTDWMKNSKEPFEF